MKSSLTDGEDTLDPCEDIDQPLHWPSEESGSLVSIDIGKLLIVVLLDLSPVSSGIECSILTSVELLLEQSEVLGFQWVDGAENVPVDSGGA